MHSTHKNITFYPSGFLIILVFIFVIQFPLFSNAQRSYQPSIDSLKALIHEDQPMDTLASIYSKLGVYYYKSDSLLQAIIFKKKAAGIYNDEKNLDKYSAHLETIGILYSFINDYRQSLKYFLDAIKILDDQNKKDEHYYSLIQNIGITYVEAEQPRQGVPFLITSMKYFEHDTISRKEYLVVNYIDLGVAYKNMKSIDSAFYYYHKALIIAQKFNISKHTGGILINLADLYGELKVYDKAKAFYQQALDEFKKNDDFRGYWHAVYGLAVVEKYLGNYTVAIDSVTKAISFFQENEDLAYLKDSYLLLSGIFEKQGDLPKAYKYFKLCSDIKDSIVASDQENQMAQLQMQYELQKSEIETNNKISLLQKENQIKIYKAYIIVGILIIALLTFGIYLIRLRSKKRLAESRLENSRLEQEQMRISLEYKQKDLENLALYIMQKNEFLEQIKAGLNEMRKNIDEKNASKVKNLSMKITQSLRKNKDLEKLSERIDQLHAVFLKQIGDRYPELTEKEKKLCVLLKLNFSSKEISVLNNISENAIMMARYRMRKKMGISTEENLTEFLQKFS
jgi:tetratricopeptide (TPR) repeat protein/DNA-binding CsgD family transcriptional regulator